MANRIFSVSEVNGYVARSLEMDPMIRQIAIRGEVSNARRYASGHWYFTLKDDASALRCVWFLSNQKGASARLEEGDRVIAQGSLGLYLRDGQYQMNVTQVRADGVGPWYERFEQLKAYCQERGWFDEDKKRPLPAYPRTIGIVTSPDGAALRDVIRVAHRRMPWVNLLLDPVLVQGEQAAEQIAQAITRLGQSKECDVIIAGRGGGSMEDLWAFNELPVVEAIAKCPVPIVSAVGHQTDFTLADFAADVRAATPSMAAELATCDWEELREAIARRQERMTAAVRRLIDQRHTGLLQAQQRLDQASPTGALAARQERLDQYRHRLTQAIARQMADRQADLQRLRALLDAINPMAVTGRGYALVRRADGGLVTDSAQVQRGDRLRITLARGGLQVAVEEQTIEEP